VVYVSRLELRGFKSFGNFKTSVSFDPSFTGITGKNGSGKSSLIEALRFVIGEMSAKQMRAERFSDLLFSGGNGFKPALFAEVSLYLDNRDGGIPLNASEVVITRRMDRQGRCAYYINGRRSSRQELVELMGSSRFSLGEYSFIFQGEMDKLARMSPLERRQLIDEMAGVAEFEEKRNKSLQELQEAQKNLEIREAELRVLEEKVRELQAAREKLVRYKEIERELRQIETWLSGMEYRGCKRELERVEGELRERDRQRASVEESLKEVREGIRGLEAKKAKLERLILTKGEGKAFQEQERLKGAIGQLEEMLRKEEQRKGELERRMGEAKPLIEFRSLLEEFRALRRKIEAARSIEDIREELRRMERILERIDEALSQLEGTEIPELPQLEYKGVVSEIAELRRKLESARSELEVKSKELEKERREISRLRRAAAEIGSKLEILRRKESELSSRLSPLQSEISHLREERGRLEERIRHLKAVQVPQGLEVSKLRRRREELEGEKEQLGKINFGAEEEFSKQNEQYQGALKNHQKLVEEKAKIEEALREVERRKREVFMEVFEQVSGNFSRIFQRLQPGGDARLVLEVPEDPFAGGIEVRVKFGKEAPERDIFGLSGGERTLVTLAFIFALQRVKPSALYVFDEVDASLDPVNAQRVAQLLKEYSKNSQLIVVTFREAVMAVTNRLLGVTKQNGISQVYSLELRRFGD
jgi:chromosome segregation protein